MFEKLVGVLGACLCVESFMRLDATHFFEELDECIKKGRHSVNGPALVRPRDNTLRWSVGPFLYTDGYIWFCCHERRGVEFCFM